MNGFNGHEQALKNYKWQLCQEFGAMATKHGIITTHPEGIIDRLSADRLFDWSRTSYGISISIGITNDLWNTEIKKRGLL